jgi:hypothetical protein
LILEAQPLTSSSHSLLYNEITAPADKVAAAKL